jgi:hypothetical protein
MEDKPTKRLGRPRKVVPGADHVGEGQGKPDHDDGDGQARADGVGAQEDASPESQGVSWPELVAIVHSLNRWERRITCVVHPEAVGVVESDKFGNLRTEVGPAGYVLSDGKRIAL